MKVSELTGAALDYWVARAELAEFVGQPVDEETKTEIAAKLGSAPYSPSTEWAQGAPIIEREHISVDYYQDGYWIASVGGIASIPDGHGPTPLVAAMRAYTASKFGQEVPDETK